MNKLNGSGLILSVKSQLAVQRYGEQVCLNAIKLCNEGNGASTISYEVFECTSAYYGKTRAADMAINAGREMLEKKARKIELEVEYDSADQSKDFSEFMDFCDRLEILCINFGFVKVDMPANLAYKTPKGFNQNDTSVNVIFEMRRNRVIITKAAMDNCPIKITLDTCVGLDFISQNIKMVLLTCQHETPMQGVHDYFYHADECSILN